MKALITVRRKMLGLIFVKDRNRNSYENNYHKEGYTTRMWKYPYWLAYSCLKTCIKIKYTSIN